VVSVWGARCSDTAHGGAEYHGATQVGGGANGVRVTPRATCNGFVACSRTPSESTRWVNDRGRPVQPAHAVWV
jgi:hypothetical protein